MTSANTVVAWLQSWPDKAWGAFQAFGDFGAGTIWFDYIAKHSWPHSWPHSCYDTREMALAGDATALEHMTNYYCAIVARQLKGKS